MRIPAVLSRAALTMAVLLVLVGCAGGSGDRLHSAPPAPAPSGRPVSPSTGKWLSGASGNGVPGGQFADWRGRSVQIAGTWSDTGDNAQHFWQLQPGGDYAGWSKPLDIAVGALGEGQDWATAATGAYDAEWASSLRTLAELRGSTTATTYIRFAHEMNGDWYPWKVNSGNYRSFIASWKRYRALQKAIFPSAELVFSLNRQSNDTRMDWRKFFPGRVFVDLISVDYYNQTPYVATRAQWERSLDLVDQWGAPNGLNQFLAYARSKGLPLALSEWSGSASLGDSPAFVTGLLGFVREHSGTGPGLIEYEILFDVPQDDSKFVLFSTTGVKMPESSKAYRTFFHSQAGAGPG